MIEVIVLLALAFIFILLAVIFDIRTTIIPNWIPYSLMGLAIGFRFFYSLFSGNFNFLFQGLIGLGIFLILGNALYYGKMFAGGDARIMIALGAVLPLTNNIFTNLEISVSFLFLFLASGAIYGIGASIYFAFKHSGSFRKEFNKLYKAKMGYNLIIMMIAILLMALGLFYYETLLYFGIIIFFLPLIYIFTKSVDETMQIKKKPNELIEGDWLYKDVKVGDKIIKANWSGLTENNIKLLKKHNKSVVIKRGVIFTPVFLISFLLLIYFYLINTNLWNSLWH